MSWSSVIVALATKLGPIVGAPLLKFVLQQVRHEITAGKAHDSLLQFAAKLGLSAAQLDALLQGLNDLLETGFAIDIDGDGDTGKPNPAAA